MKSIHLQILREVPATINQLQHEATHGVGSANRILPRLADLLYCLMECHSGYPQQYSRILESISVSYLSLQRCECKKVHNHLSVSLNSPLRG
jgi:hypothetical protein